jgi:HK97 family phage major capsid protein
MARTLDTIGLEQKAVLKKQAEILDKVQKEKRNLTKEEEREYAALDADFADLEDEKRFLHKTPEYARWLKQSEKPPTKPSEGLSKPSKDDEAAMMGASRGKGDYRMTEKNAEYRYDENDTTNPRNSFNKYLLHGTSRLNAEEVRALQADNDLSGGYLLAPVQLATEIIAALDDAVYVRQLARTFRLETAESLGAPALDDDFGSPEWTAELKTGSEDNTMSFDKRQLFPHPIARRIKVSNKLLRMSTLNPEAFIKERMVSVMGTVQENAFMNGTGANQPLGLFVASPNGINTDRDFACAAQTSIKVDDLIGAVGALKAQYRRNATWIFSREVETALQKLKDGEGNYLLRRDLSTGVTSSLLGFKCCVSEFAPKIMTTGKYVMLLGDLKYFWICDALDMQIQRLVELYAETNQSAFIIRSECDAAPVLSSAFVRVRMA